jgi:hypothetical protein
MSLTSIMSETKMVLNALRKQIGSKEAFYPLVSPIGNPSVKIQFVTCQKSDSCTSHFAFSQDLFPPSIFHSIGCINPCQTMKNLTQTIQ